MTSLDDLIKNGLKEEDQELVRQFAQPTLPEEIAATFRGRLRWMVALVWFFTILFSGLMFFCLYQLFHVETVRSLILCATGVGFSVVAVSMYKMWYWMQLNQNAVLREIKRVELQLAVLAQHNRSS